ncbi:copper resistance system multicopper oxidase [Nitrosospira multiformis]|uniref:copper resistance system multicopper oxidase n=1 Tax=Nitrosospira multiformis TaxID=1231 RepID=UPI000942C8C5|nr:copper resistance system multicopper oxidase [Nitrosospira multiformis]
MKGSISRRHFLKGSGALGALFALDWILPAHARGSAINAVAPTTQLSGDVIDLTIAETPFHVGERVTTAITINGTVPGPLLRLREGQDITLNVTNRLPETSSIHWHGILLPPGMDGVPGVSFPGIEPGTTFRYRFTVKQYGTYWFHSHSGGQEQAGAYGSITIDPAEPDLVRYDREYVIMLSDWSFSSVGSMIGKLKKQPGYFNFQKRTLGDFIRDGMQKGWRATLDDYLMWAQMRMDPTDLADVTSHAYTYLMNGLAPAGNWTGLFRPGERIRLRFIQVGVMTFQDVRIPGLKMTVVQADGQNVQPVEVDEFRMGPAETYDVIVEPQEDRAYTIFAETLDRSGFARGTLAPRPGMSAEIPPQRRRPVRSMADMGMQHMNSMDHGGHNPGNATTGEPETRMQHDMHGDRAGEGLQDSHEMHGRPEILGSKPVKHGPDDHGTGNQSVPDFTQSRLDDPGIGLGGDGRRVLVYTDLKSLRPYPNQREPEREFEIHLTGHMERFMWSFDGKKYSDAKEPIRFRYGERLRWTFVNDTMMEHTMHLHGMWMHLENGAGEYLPRKHTVLVKPAERVSVAITADAPGPWAFHCHLLLHMETGMFRVIEVSDAIPEVKP